MNNIALDIGVDTDLINDVIEDKQLAKIIINIGPPFLKQYYNIVKLNIITTNIPTADIIDKNT